MWFCYDLMITILQGYFCCQVGTPNAQHFQNLLWFFFCSGKLRICPQFHSLGLELDIANKHCILQFLYREKRQKFSLLCEMVTRCRIVSKNLGFFFNNSNTATTHHMGLLVGWNWTSCVFLLLYGHSHTFAHICRSVAGQKRLGLEGKQQKNVQVLFTNNFLKVFFC